MDFRRALAAAGDLADVGVGHQYLAIGVNHDDRVEVLVLRLQAVRFALQQGCIVQACGQLSSAVAQVAVGRAQKLGDAGRYLAGVGLVGP